MSLNRSSWTALPTGGRTSAAPAMVGRQQQVSTSVRSIDSQGSFVAKLAKCPHILSAAGTHGKNGLRAANRTDCRAAPRREAYGPAVRWLDPLVRLPHRS